MREAFGQAWYDVSLEDVVQKAVPAPRMEAVAPAELQALVQLGMQLPAPTDAREGILRERHLRFLAGALAQAQAGAADAAPADGLRFVPGDRVATRSAGAWQLATVRGCVRTHEGVRYELVLTDEVAYVGEEDVVALDEVCADGSLRLGDRVRMLAEGHEADDAFVGVVCLVEPQAAGVSYGIVFDDGDVFEGLCDKDLVRVDG